MIISIKHYFWAAIFILLLGGGIYINILSDKLKTETETKEIAILNYKAAVLTGRVYKLSYVDIKASKDSADIKIQQYIKELKIKPKTVTNTFYIHDTVPYKNDVYIKDTVLAEGVNIDTTFKSKWFYQRLILKYPNNISIDTKVNNELVGVINTQRETIEVASKWWIVRLFQKKQTVVICTVKNLNPNATKPEVKFTEILK